MSVAGLAVLVPMMRRSFNIVGIMIVKLRCARSLTQDALATKVQLLGYPLTRQGVAHIEAGRCGASDTLLVFIARAFGVTVLDLFPLLLRHNPTLETLERLC